jgi:non-heme chloroperoxidase
MRLEWYPKTFNLVALSTASILHSVSGRTLAGWKRAANRVKAARRLRQIEENSKTKGEFQMPYISVAKENSGAIDLYYKDWGSGQPVVFSHGWPLSADAWDDQMLFLASRGYRCIAHDRRGHGRSSQPWNGNDMDTYADDLAKLVEALGLKDAIHVGHSTGGGEVARYIGRHGSKRVAKAVLISAVPPLMLKTVANPGGLPIEVFDGIRSGLLADRSQFFKDLSAPFYGANRPGAKVSQGLRDSFWLQGMQAGFNAVYDCVKAFSETDQTEDLKKLDAPTLIIHGDDDQIVPIGASAMLSSKIVKNSTLKIYPGAPHGLTSTHKDQVNADLLEFLKG